MYPTYCNDLHNAAKSPNTPPNILGDLMASRDPKIRVLVASNISTPLAVLNTLARDMDDKVCAAVARNPSAPLDVICYLALSAQPSIRSAVASNPMADEELLTRLADDHHPDVRSAVAANHSTPSKVLEQVLRYADKADLLPTVAIAAAGNSKTPLPTLLTMAFKGERKEVIVLAALATLKRITGQQWADGVRAGEVYLGLILAQEVPPKTLGDALLSSDMTSAYQHIQSAELALRIESKVDQRPLSIGTSTRLRF